MAAPAARSAGAIRRGAAARDRRAASRRSRHPEAALPWTREERLVAFAIVGLHVFVTYHLLAQHFGALSSIVRESDGAARMRTRSMDRLFALGVGGVLVVVADVLAGAVAVPRSVGRSLVDSLHGSSRRKTDPRRRGAGAACWRPAAMLVAELRAPRWSPPRVLYILGIAVMVAIALFPRSPFLFLVIWTSAALDSGDRPQRLRCRSRSLLRCAVPHAEALHSLNVYGPGPSVLILVLSSVVLLPLFEVEANRQDGTYYGDRLFGAFATGLRRRPGVPVSVRARVSRPASSTTCSTAACTVCRSPRARGGAVAC